MQITIEEEYMFTPEVTITHKDKQTTLPHGSGIDSNYFLEENKNQYLIYNSYHIMDDVGFYRCWIDFKVVIPKENPKDFKIKFPGCNSTGYYWIERRQLRPYLEALYSMVLDEVC